MIEQKLKTRSTGFLMVVLLSSLVAINGVLLASTDPEKALLFERLANAETEQESRIAEGAVWRFWFDQSPTPEIRTLLDAGMERRQAYDYEAAENHLDKVVEIATDYAEGYNQRAFVRFLRENYSDAQADLEIVLELEPDHFGALSGLYLILSRQDRQKVALKMLQKAVDIHPWLNERSALPRALWSDKYRDIHEQGLEI
jgi:tetratricopeptide (TPR) repeat protein